MTIVGRLFAILVLATLAVHAGAGVRYPASDGGADVLHQQDGVQPGGVLLKEEEEDEEEEEEDEEPDCE
ncbi:MAG: hypothetical protein OXC25_12335 [Thiotrichales bacterium]|nr:hypothetical protein [Thiotrichales bacterium]MCY4350624.1 hypothetical protein [Thiotrichales bacterium]